MTHMHIPDGILPVWLWLLGFGVMILAIAFSLHRVRRDDLRKKIPLLGAVSAVMLVSMSLEILPLAYHVNLSVVAGILLGPALGLLAACVTNLMLALMGHGGVTVIGLNTLLIGTEALIGHTLFFLLYRRKGRVLWPAVISTFCTLALSTMVLIGIVAVAHVDPALLHEGDPHGMHRQEQLSLARFAAITISLGVLGWILESIISGTIIRFIDQVRPDLLGHILHRKSPRASGSASA